MEVSYTIYFLANIIVLRFANSRLDTVANIIKTHGAAIQA